MGRYNNKYGDYDDEYDDMNKEQNKNIDSGFDINYPPLPSPHHDFESPTNVVEFWQLMKLIGQRRKWLISMGFLVLELGD